MNTTGPSTASKGLLVHYDFQNPKSWLGAPVTTNFQWNSGAETTPNAIGTNGVGAIDVTGTSEAGPVKNAKTWKMVKNAQGNQWNGWEGTYGGFWTGASGDVWSLSYWYKTSAPAGQTGFSQSQYYLSNWSRPYSSTILANVDTIIADGEWHYNYCVFQFNEAYSNAIIADGPSWPYSTTAGVLYINGLQWNKNAYATTFSPGGRTLLNGLVDLTGNSSPNAGNLAYTNLGVPYFNGSNNYIDISTNLGVQAAYSFCIWARRDSESKMFFSTRADTSFYWYGNNSWRFTHGGTGGEFYYPHPTTIPVGQIALYCVTYTGSLISIYLNGILQGTVASFGTADFTQGLKIGDWTGGGSYAMNGYLYDFAMFNRALSTVEINDMFNAGRGRFGI